MALSALLQLFEASSDISLFELVKRPDGRIEERKAPRELPSNEVTVLDVYGHLFYAGARTLEQMLPRPENSHNPVVILRLRGRSSLGVTLIDVLASYADRLRAAGGRPSLTGISQGAYDQMVRTGRLRLSGPVRVYEASATVGQSTHEAYEEARTWLVGHSDEAAEGEEALDGAAPEGARPNGREPEGET